ncbi:MAG: phage tail protein [Gallionella sp.]|nr:phage tail protein [Gallionella sp.]
MLTVKFEGLEAVKRTLEKLPQEMRDKAIRPAINKVAEKARAEINRAITQEFAVKASEVRNAVEIRKARGDKLEAVISIFGSSRKIGRSLNMIHFLAAVQAAGQAFKVRGKKLTKADRAALQQQLGFLIKKGGGIKKIEGAFLGNKGRTVFIREGKGRLPIKPLQVIGFSQMFNSKRISNRVIQKINDDLPIEVDRAIKMLIGKGLL